MQGQRITPYRFFCKHHNIGDAINSHIIESVSSNRALYVRGGQEHILAIGSIFFLANKRSVIWGSGIMDPHGDLSNVDFNRIRAVRGRLTLSILKERGMNNPTVALGDPGILVNRLLDNCSIDKKHHVSLVPHCASMKDVAIWNFARSAGVNVIDMRDATLRPLHEIAASEIIISQSLHGLIFAEALGIPNVWISLRNDERWRFKFHDWFSTTKRPQAMPFTLDHTIGELRQNAVLHEIAISKDKLISKFPHDISLQRSNKREEIVSIEDKNGLMFIKNDIIDWAMRTENANYIRDQYKKAMSSVEYPVYSMFGPSKPSAELRRKLVEVMNDEGRADFALIRSPNTNIAQCSRVVSVHVSQTTTAGISVLLRPDGRINFNKKRAVISVE